MGRATGETARAYSDEAKKSFGFNRFRWVGLSEWALKLLIAQHPSKLMASCSTFTRCVKPIAFCA